jgi:VWFA-related protein
MMPTRLCAIVFAALTAVGLAAQQQEEAARFTASPAELVVLSVVVNDRRGQDVPNLDRDRFSLYDNNQPQPIALFSNEDEPVSVGLLIDTSGSMKPKLAEVVIAAAAFARSSNPADELFVTTFSDDVREARGGRALEASDIEEINAELTALRAAGQTALYDGLMTGLDRMLQAAHPRKILLLVSDGGDNASVATLGQVLDRARRENVSIYTIGLFDDGGTDRNPKVLEELARSTGGVRFLPDSPGHLLAICQRVAHEIRTGYTIAFVPPARDGRYHRVRVDVRAGSDRLGVRTRPGYLAAADTPARKP